MTTLFDIEHADEPIAIFVLAHGAGAGKNHHFLNDMSALLLERGISVVRFNFPFMSKREVDGKRRPPDRFPVLIEHYKKVLMTLETDLPVFIGGKSMGSRVAATLLSTATLVDTQLNEQKSLEQFFLEAHISINGGIAIGYPFHPQKKHEKLRLAPLQNLQRPVLICQGDRDALGSEKEIEGYDISPLCKLLFLADGDHDIKPRVKSGFTHQAHKVTTADAIKEFIYDNR